MDALSFRVKCVLFSVNLFLSMMAAVSVQAVGLPVAPAKPKLAPVPMLGPTLPKPVMPTVKKPTIVPKPTVVTKKPVVPVKQPTPIKTPEKTILETPNYNAYPVSSTIPAVLGVGEEAWVEFTYRNTGKKPWLSTGYNYISLYRYERAKKQSVPSVFAHPTWLAKDQVARIPVATVSVGDITTMRFKIKAPTKPGIYDEDFVLTAENAVWMRDGFFHLHIMVGQTATSSSPVLTQKSPNESIQTSVAPSVSVVDPRWKALLVDKGGGEWFLQPGEYVEFDTVFTNVGTAPWIQGSTDAPILVPVNEDGSPRRSSFSDTPWRSATSVSVQKNILVRPQEDGRFRLYLRAPNVPGKYTETFALKNTSGIIPGSIITLPVHIPITNEFIATSPFSQEEIRQMQTDFNAPLTVSPSSPLQAELLKQSVSTFTSTGNARIEISVAIKNTGQVSWTNEELQFLQLDPFISTRFTSVREEFWKNAIVVAEKSLSVKPGELIFFTFRVKTPAKKGKYTATFRLFANGRPTVGGDMKIALETTADGEFPPEQKVVPVAAKPSSGGATSSGGSSVTYNNQPVLTPMPLNGDVSALAEEPLIRVGVYKVPGDTITVAATFAPASVYLNGSSVCQLNMGQSIQIQFDRTQKVYRLSGGPCSSQSSATWYVVRTNDTISPLEVPGMSRPGGVPAPNDNDFRRQLELRYSPATGELWVINELPIEYYLKGIAETTRAAGQEFARTLLTVARTYAVYHVTRGTKHADTFFTVDGDYDQVYRGYSSEIRLPNVVAAVEATRGQIVTYNGKLAITPYFSRSDGRTRDWTEVWGGGPFPWMVSVPVPWDQGKTLWGHGVGMSASGAVGMAADGKTYDEILRYFYRGTELRRAYR